jgi:hypothetical protein
MEIQLDDVWVSLDTGNRWRVTKLYLPSWPHQGPGKCGKVQVMRLNPPKWDDGVYIFAAETFRCMRLEERAGKIV